MTKNYQESWPHSYFPAVSETFKFILLCAIPSLCGGANEMFALLGQFDP
jgi:hypothetical protein